MARWYKDESMARAMRREGGDILKEVGRELLSIGTLGFYTPVRTRRGRVIEIRYPNGKVVKIRQ